MVVENLILSIFPGIGLLDRAFEEEMPEICLVRGPDLLWGGDIRRFHVPAGMIWGVIGGPPCPEFSPLRYLIAAHGYKPKHGDLIPEFERIVAESQPEWFLMEEGIFAPDCSVPGYAVHGFLLSPLWLGEEQSRKRRFCFGVKGVKAVDLRRWIVYAAFEPLVPKNTVYSTLVNNDPRRKGRPVRIRQPAVTHHADPYPVRLGGSGKAKVRAAPVLTSGQPTFYEDGRVKKAPRRSLQESCRLQGLPEDFLKDTPFTLTGKRQAIGNGVPLSMGRAIAKAIKAATGRDD